MNLSRARSVTVSALLAMVLASHAARAQQAAPSAAPAVAPSKESCSDAYADSQVRRRNNELLVARQKLRLCASDACPGFMRPDCVEWLAQVERAIPTVVLEAKNDKGYVFDATVTVDGVVVATQLDGKSIELDPGVHTFRFAREGSPPIEEKLIVRESERGRLVSVSWASATPAVVPTPVPDPTVTARSSTMSERVEPSAPKERPVPASVWIAAGAGVVFTGVFTALALSGNSEKSSLNASCAPFCSDSQVNKVKTRYLLADLSLGVGIASFVTAAVLYVSRPERDHVGKATPAIDVRASASGATVEWAGRF